MYNIVTTAKPITPDGEASLVFLQGDDFTNFVLTRNRPINFLIENDSEKFCTGWHDLTTGINYPCDKQEQILTKHSDCFACRQKTGFNPAFYNTTELSAVQEEFNKQPHLVYIAYFGGGLVKAGITVAKRGHKRLYEQGALFYTIVDEFPNATTARNLEARLVRQGLKESVLKNTKSNILKNPLNLAKEETMFSDFLQQNDYKGAKIENNIEMYFFGDYPEEPIKPFVSDQQISGKVRGVVGRYLVLENNDRLYGVWLSDYFGRKIKIDDEIISLERDLQQVSLF